MTSNYHINKNRPDIKNPNGQADYYTLSQIKKWIDLIRGDISTEEFELLERIRDEQS